MGGLLKYDGSQFTQMKTEMDFKTTQLQSFIDDDGPWVGTDNGLVNIKNHIKNIVPIEKKSWI